ncbi:uncharacterized protein LOC142175646 [Nicotiana tabacum]|uniref:Uncharacterized protein LOC142175646 n=1 Tax=Nicotiana tabacum TaxID=4097 RepID=A0AC58TN63_TOBAC
MSNVNDNNQQNLPLQGDPQHQLNQQAIDEALKKLIAQQVSNALQAFTNQLPVVPPTPTPNNNTLENHRSGLVNSGSGGAPSESRDGEPGYNQIKMDSLDEEKTSFITDRGTYLYKAMQFGLKNDGATYQRLILCKFNMKLNPQKCAFGVSSGKFLGFLVSNRDIELNPAQIKAIEEISDILTSKKEVQRLTGRITALGRFISKSLEKCFKFFSALKKQNQFEWSEECQQALKNLKVYLSNPPLLAKPKDGEKLFVYLAVSEVAVSAVLVREDQGKQSPIYYVSKSLLDAETRYPHLEKLALALTMASRKLRPYFQCHPISMITAYPLRNILHKQDLSGRLAKWAIELSEYDITYQPRIAIKSQVLADFVADFSQGIHLEAEKQLQIFNGSKPGTWTLFTDGSSNVKGAGLGIVPVPPTGETIRQAIKCHPITNNEAEYEVVIAAREARVQQYLEKARDLVRQFQIWKVMQIPREENAEADALANLASAAENFSKVGKLKGLPQHLTIWWVMDKLNQQISFVAGNQFEVIINNLKKKLEESKGNWLEVLSGVLWAYRTRETPVLLVYGAETLIPVEIR